VENRDGIIAVSGDGTVFGNGVYDGHFNVDLTHDINGIIRPFGLSLYHPHPRDVLMIGLASGSWGQVIAANPDVAHFTIVEINPGYLPLIRERPEVASLLRNPKVRIIIDDGRRWLRRHPQARFDAVMANTSYHFRANASNVLSMEFADLIRAHLKTGGIFFYNTTSSHRSERTGCLSFRHGYRVLNHMLLSDAPFDLDVARWRRNLLATRIDGKPVFDLARPRDAAALRWTLAMPDGAQDKDHPERRRMEACGSILAATTKLDPITDDNMGTEWRYPLGFE
jgi:spermidine synthase